MVVDDVVLAFGDAVERALKRLVVEGADTATVEADDVVVVVGGASGLVSGFASPEIEPVDEPQPEQHVERPVDAGEANGLFLGPESVEDLVRGKAAIFAGQKLDNRAARAAGSMTRLRQAGGGVATPVLRGGVFVGMGTHSQ